MYKIVDNANRKAFGIKHVSDEHGGTIGILPGGFDSREEAQKAIIELEKTASEQKVNASQGGSVISASMHEAGATLSRGAVKPAENVAALGASDAGQGKPAPIAAPKPLLEVSGIKYDPETDRTNFKLVAYDLHANGEKAVVGHDVMSLPGNLPQEDVMLQTVKGLPHVDGKPVREVIFAEVATVAPAAGNGRGEGSKTA